ncbi:TIGR01777 family oxidoreductase [Verrucomicrobiaceae bacterium R5-34]|nr:TIGR01777 family oxidoreductase [Verrucomicrobiaceae bacterium R5-34]
MKKLLVAGANGFLAKQISGYFAQLGWSVSGLARREGGLHPECRYVHWDGNSLGDWTSSIDDCDVLINMVGRSINCRHTEENKQQILQSRLQSTAVLGRAVAQSETPPSLWINGSAAGIYQESYDQAMDESGAEGEGFIADVVKQWEAEFFKAEIASSVRRVALRTTMVLADTPDNPYRYLQTLAKTGLGGKVGSGRQMVSWVHIDDVPRVVQHIIDHEDLTGPVNMAAPEAVTNAEMMRRFRQQTGMPIGLPAPAFAVKIGASVIGTAPELILQSSWVEPGKLLGSGFTFTQPKMALGDW